jgi:hypothetical protein
MTKIGCGLVVLVIVVNVTLGTWATQYVVAFWTLYLKGVAVHLPFLPAAVAGLFLAEIVIPLAIATWILSFIL